MGPPATHICQGRPMRRTRLVTAIALVGGCLTFGAGSQLIASADAPAPLPSGTYCQGPQATQPATGPTHVMNIVLENESSVAVDNSPDATFERGTLDAQCGTFSETAMHSITHPSEPNYVALESGLNPAINSGNDGQANFALSNCPPNATNLPPTSGCTNGRGQIAASTPSLYSLIEQQYGVAGWKGYADDMLGNCAANDGNVYNTVNGTAYNAYVVRHNPAPFFAGASCATQSVPSGDWKNQQGALYTDLISGNMPYYSFIQPNDIESGHDPVSAAGGTSQVGNIDHYLAQFMALVQQSPQYQDGSLVVMITFDEGIGVGPVPGEDSTGENCADPNISVQAVSCQIKTWIVGRYVPNYTYTTYMNLYGLLAANQRLLGLPPLLAHAGDSATPDIVNGSVANPDPFNLAPTGVSSAPSAPTSVTATGGNASASVAFTAPFSVGGSPVTTYTVTSDPGNLTATSAASPIAIPGLTNNTAYTFTVTATNSTATGVASAPSNAVTPVAPTTPGAPTGLAATPGDGRVNLSWTAPPPVSGVPITDYIVQYRLTGTSAWTPVDEGSTATTAAITGLTNNTSYDFTVTALNSGGAGPPSAVTTSTPAVQPTQLLPDPGFEAGNGGWIAFKIGTLSRVTSPVHGGSNALRVASPSTSVNLVGLTQNTVINNSVAGRSYTASCYVQPTSGTLNVTIRWLEYTQNYGSVINLQSNLTNALPLVTWTLVQVTSTAVNSGERMIPQIYSTNETSANGSLLYDDCSVTAASGTTSPSAPGAPTGVSATAGVASAVVSFAAPNANGSPITGYTVTSNPGNVSAAGTGSPMTVPGLTNGTAYNFTVTATNAIGTSAASAPSNPVTPRTTPSAPTAVVATAGDGTASVAFSAPTSNGGAAITSYTVTATPGTATGSGVASPITVTGLTNGTSYTFIVTATNAAGTGPASAPSNSVTPAPTLTTQLLPDPGFESGNGGWIAFKVGTLTRVSTPVHGGAFALRVAATGTTANLVGLTQNTVVSNSVAGRSYTVSCYVQPTSSGTLDATIRFLEYTQNYSSNTPLQTVTVTNLPLNTWTLMQVTGVAVRAGERIIPQIYSSKETTANGSLVYDDCSMTSS
jgi:hypothetical protein